jgi:hypothetical protein
MRSNVSESTCVGRDVRERAQSGCRSPLQELAKTIAEHLSIRGVFLIKHRRHLIAGLLVFNGYEVSGVDL